MMGGSVPFVDNYPQDNVHNYSQDNANDVPDLYRNQPPRPRSADFLERDGECVAVPDVALYPEKRQPQRPKSSLEYYDRYMDSEDGNFDYYREAVRIQADNLYANKNLRKGQSPRPMTYDPRVNIHYMGGNNNNCYMANEQVSPCYGSTTKDPTIDRYDDCANVSMSSSQNDPSVYGKPPKPKEESMQRLLEWKQRMLQSPLTKRNHIQTNSSGNSSPMTSPMKTYKSEHQQKVFRDLQAHNTRFHSNPTDYRSHSASPQRLTASPNQLPVQSDHQQKVFRDIQSNDSRFHGKPSRSSDYIARSHSASPQRPTTDTRRRNESSSSRAKSPSFTNIQNSNFSNIENPKFSPKLPDPCLDTSVDIPVENLYKDKVMYCVDSENNEILFSYDDTSPTSGAPKSLQTCHYPPQMHSFTTMPNVSNIGSDNPVYSKYEERGTMGRIHRDGRHSLPRSSQGFKGLWLFICKYGLYLKGPEVERF